MQEKDISAVGRARPTLRALLVVGDQRGSMGSSPGCYQRPCAQNLERPKLKMSEFKEIFIAQEGTNRGDWRLNGASNPSCLLRIRLRIFKGLREQVYKSAGEQLEDLGIWPSMVRGVNTRSSWTMKNWLLKGLWYSSSNYVLVL